MLKKLFLGIPKRVIIISALGIIIWGVMNAFLSSALSVVTAASFENNEFVKAALFFTGYIVIWELVEFICDISNSMLEAYLRNGNYEYYFQRLYHTKPEALQKGNTGYIAGILTQLIDRKRGLFFDILLGGIGSVYIIYFIFYFLKFSFWFSLVMIAIVLLGICVCLICIHKTESSLKNMTVARGDQTRIFMDGIHNIATIQKLRGISFIENKTKECNKRNVKETRSWTTGNEIGFCLYKGLSYMLCPICMFVAYVISQRDSDFSMVEFMSLLSIITIQLVHNVKSIANFIRDYSLFAATQREMDDIVKEQSTNYTSTSIGNQFHEIKMIDINYQYKEGENETTIQIPEFVILKGDKICITGESGQGKTTLLKILSGMIETKDKIFIDGKEQRDNIDAVYIAQDTEMLDMTLRENLTFGNENISDDRLINMMDAVGLSDWYQKQEQGLDTILGERGVFVSTGQRQRLNILRGLLIDKEIYLLDEPTSNVDDVTEEKMIHLIGECLKDKTVIIVTHKERIRELCSREYVFRENTVVGRDDDEKQL